MAEPQQSTVGKSPAEHLRESFRVAQERKTVDLRMAGYDELHVVFRGMDYREVRRMVVEGTQRGRHLDDIEREKTRAVAVLVQASTDSYVVIDKEKVEIGLPLGLALYDYIWPPEPVADGEPPAARPGNDYEAAILLFLDDLKLMAMYAQYEMWTNGIGVEATGELLGNF